MKVDDPLLCLEMWVARAQGVEIHFLIHSSWTRYYSITARDKVCKWTQVRFGWLAGCYEFVEKLLITRDQLSCRVGGLVSCIILIALRAVNNQVSFGWSIHQFFFSFWFLPNLIIIFLISKKKVYIIEIYK